ncbi:MAG TPA: alpha/beta hydrolase, partial [Verrucomicrobiota bacterium]|nr:alpha/beta hydrolase [Verrucomicrobiota bacterium]
FNDKSFQAESTRQLLATEFDPYSLNKLYYTRKRAIEIANTQPAMASENTPQTQTLQAVFNRPQDDKFHDKAGTIKVHPVGFRKALPASVWMQSRDAPIAFIIPGLGGHRLGTQALALAELAYQEGYNVVCFSNNLNWEFIQAAPADYLPGYLDDDLQYLRQVHEATTVKIGAKTKGKPAVMGFSMGGWYTLNLAASSPPEAYSASLAINPPLDLNTGLRMLDKLFRAPAGEKDLDLIKESALVKLLVSQRRPSDQGALPFSDQEASFLIGLSYRLTLTQTIMSSLDITPSSKAHKKIGTLGWEDYYSKIVAPTLASRKIHAEALSSASNLRTREAGLTAAKHLKLVLTGNDFLLTQQDLAWFRKRFPGDRTIYTETGGHMGQLWKPGVRESMRAAIRWNHADSSSK